MHPILTQEIGRYMIEERARRAREAVAYQGRRGDRGPTRRVRKVLGHALVRAGIRLAGSKPLARELAGIDGHVRS